MSVSPDRYQKIVAESDAKIRAQAEHAYSLLLGKIRAGDAPQTAINAVMKQFNAGVTSDLATVFSALLATKLGPAEMRNYQVGGVKLSDRLYANAQAVSATTKTVIEQHMKGPHSARELAKTLYEGYKFKEDELKVIAGLPKYLKVEFNKALAAKLKTPALRAAYLQAIREAEAGKGMDALAKVLKVAFYERNRYFANRIARTELHRNFSEQRSREWMASDRIQYIQLRLSSKHPKTDICDYHANLNAYGLGPGIYPKAKAPQPPFHPHCLCLTAPFIDINPKSKPTFNPNAERSFLASLPPNEARQIAGSRAKLERALKGGESLEDIYNEGKDELYKWRKVGDVEVIPAFIRSSTVQQAEQEALKLGVKSVDYRQSLDIANDVNDALAQLPKMGILPPDKVQIDTVPFTQWAKQYGFNPNDMSAAFSFHPRTGEARLFVNPASGYWANKAAYAKHQKQIGYWSTDHPDHAIWHELGHLMHYQNSPVAYQAHIALSPADLVVAGKVSGYAQDGVREFIAETFAALALGKPQPSDVLSLYQLLGGILP